MTTKNIKKNTKKTNSNNDFDVIQYIKDDINNSSKSELEHMKSNGNYLLSIEDNPMIRKIINNQLELVENRLFLVLITLNCQKQNILLYGIKCKQ